MAHNFIWTSNGVANVPAQLLVGLEVDEKNLAVWNQNPEKEESVMGKMRINTEFDWTKVTDEWFTASLKTVDSNTFLYVNVKDPAVTEYDKDEDMMQMTHLQIIKETNEHMYLYLAVHNDLVDPRMVEMRFMQRHPREYQEMKDREYQEKKAAEEAVETETQAE